MCELPVQRLTMKSSKREINYWRIFSLHKIHTLADVISFRLKPVSSRDDSLQGNIFKDQEM